MSEDIQTINDDIIVDSLASNGKYHLSSFKKGVGMLKEISYPYEEYGILIRKLWEDLLERNIKPQLLEQTLTDDGFGIETLHYIAPNSFYFPTDDFILDWGRESLTYWLKLQSPNIKKLFSPALFRGFDRSLNEIIRINITRKEKADEYRLLENK